MLVKLINSYLRLETGSALLPSLIEFYQWIITDLSNAITQKESEDMSISEAVAFASEKYSKEVQNHYLKLFEYVKGMCL